MDWIVYAISYSLIWLLSWLPSRILYLFSDLCAFLLWYVIPYRKKTVLKNLTLAFPEKQTGEIRKIAKRSCHHFCDTFIEAMMGMYMNLEEHNRKYQYTNIDLLKEIYTTGKDILLITGHYANWEWISSLPKFIDYRVLAVYKTLHNRYFDKRFIRLRGKFGMIPVVKEKAFRTMIECQKKKIPITAYFVADQSPRWSEVRHWIPFLNQITPVLLGPEKTALKLNMVVVFLYIKKVRRGFYELTFIPLVMDPSDSKPYEITEKYYQVLERIIREKPEDYLWTHDRWKHTRKYKQYMQASASKVQQQ